LATLLLELPGAVSRLLLFFTLGGLLLLPVYFIIFLILWALMMILPVDVTALIEYFARWLTDLSPFFVSLLVGDLDENFPAFVVLVLHVLLTLFFGFGNILLSLSALSGVMLRPASGNTFTRFVLGARDPSRRERRFMHQAITQLEKGAPERSRAPNYWYVLDSPYMNAYIVGSTLYVTRELLRSEYLPAVVAHEFGHLNSPDGRLTLALRRFVMPYTYLLNPARGKQVAPGTLIVLDEEMVTGQALIILNFLMVLLMWWFALAGGGLGLYLLNPVWTWYWRRREYYADNYAAQCGLAHGLIDYLEHYQFFDVSVPFHLSAHPYTELRIDKLQWAVEQEAELRAKQPKGEPVQGMRFRYRTPTWWLWLRALLSSIIIAFVMVAVILILINFLA
jgi:Zn-dependent protease with chaperone function